MTPHIDQTPGVYTVLNLGCGERRATSLPPIFQEPGWKEVRIDADASVKPDIVTSLTNLSMIPSGRIHAVYSSHSLEHIYAHEVPRALAEFLRVLRPEGIALITLPDLQRISELVVADQLDTVVMKAPLGEITVRDVLFGHGPSIALGQTFMAHKTGFTARTLGQALLSAGFASVDITRRDYDLWALAHKTNH